MKEIIYFLLSFLVKPPVPLEENYCEKFQFVQNEKLFLSKTYLPSAKTTPMLMQRTRFNPLNPRSD